MKKKILFILIIAAAMYLASSTDKELLMRDCIDWKGGSDQDCKECYLEIYGEPMKK